MDNKVLRRLLSILNTLESNPQGLSARELAELTGYAKGIVLNDLNDILDYTDLASYFTVYPDLEDLDPDEDEEMYGEYDPGSIEIKNPEVKWFLSCGEDPYPALRLTLPEAVALALLFREYPPSGQLKDLCDVLEENLLPEMEAAAADEMAHALHTHGGVSLADSKYLDLLREAVLEERKIEVRYYSKHLNEIVHWLLWPLGLVYYSGTGIWYLVAQREDTGEVVFCHLERIRQVVKGDAQFDYPDNFSLRQYLKRRWGMDRRPPQTVKVRFYNEANIVEKVLREFAARGLPRPREMPDGSLEYHGEILGIRTFSKWVLSFGSSAEVLEPAWLREEMIRIAGEWLRLYGVAAQE